MAYEINTSPIKEILQLFLMKHYTHNFKKLVNFKVAIKEMYKRIPWQLDALPSRSVAHTLGTTGLDRMVLITRWFVNNELETLWKNQSRLNMKLNSNICLMGQHATTEIFNQDRWSLPMNLKMGLLYMKREYYSSYGSMQSHTASHLLTATVAKFSVPPALMTSIVNCTYFLP